MNRPSCRISVLLILTLLLTGCAELFKPGGTSSAAGGSDGGALARLRGDGANHLLGDVVWAGRKRIQSPQMIRAQLFDPGGKAHDRAVGCTLQSCSLQATSGGDDGWSLDGLSPGKYAIEIRTQADVLARVEFQLVSVPTIGGKTSLEPDFSPHVGKLETVFTQRKVWLPRDKRMPNREVSWLWLKDGEFVSAQVASVSGPDIDGPLVDYWPVEVRAPLARGIAYDGSWELLLFWTDSKEPVAHFDVTFPKPKVTDQRAMGQRNAGQVRAAQQAEPPPWTVVNASSPSDATVKTALAHVPHGAPPPKPHTERWACAVALDPAAGKAASDMKRVKQTIFRIEQQAGFAMQDARDTARFRAAQQGRQLSVGEENHVNDLMETGLQSVGVPEQLRRLYAKVKELGAKIDELSTKQPSGCMAKALPGDLRDAATAPSAPH